jgi:hypothetical protein
MRQNKVMINIFTWYACKNSSFVFFEKVSKCARESDNFTGLQKREKYFI